MRWLACAAALVLAGCAGGFPRPAPETLRLGETTPAELIQRLGPPAIRQTLERRGKEIVLLVYTYSTETERHHGDAGVIATRTLFLFFHQERLVGHEYRSTVARDHTDFDMRKARSLVKGRSTREDVTRLLGPPSGYLVFPMIDASLSLAMTYSYFQQRRVPFGAPLPFSKTLLITLGPDGTVNEATYEISGDP